MRLDDKEKKLGLITPGDNTDLLQNIN